MAACSNWLSKKSSLRTAIPVVLFFVTACQAKHSPSTPSHTVTLLGAAVPPGDPTSLVAVLTNPEAFIGKTVLVEGHVRAACQRKGCWMELTPNKESTTACRIRFKDYGFFVPTDSKGANARLQGELSLRTIPVSEVAHLEAEGAHLMKAADGSAKAVEIVASGVELVRL